MKFIPVPSDVVLVNPQDGKRFKSAEGGDEPAWSMYAFLLRWVLPDVKWGKTMVDVFAASKVKVAFEHAKVGDVVELEDDDYKRLLEIVRAPSNPYNPTIVLQCVEFLRAIEDARSERPAKARNGRVTATEAEVEAR